MENKEKHIPVLIDPIIEIFNPKDNGVYVDGTFGAGGYTKRFLEAANCTVIAFDRDETVRPTADEFKKQYGDRFVFVNDVFSNMHDRLQELGCEKVDGVILDIGVSSMQIDNENRGFAFRFEKAGLDMRMGNCKQPPANEILNTFLHKDLMRIFKEYGEEKLSFKIASNIVNVREEKPFKTVADLVNVIKSSVGEKRAKSSIQRIFQALRIFINDELEELKKVLNDTDKFIKPDGVVGVVSFHSLEDKIVKNFFKKHTIDMQVVSRYSPGVMVNNNFEDDKNMFFKTASRKAIVATKEELDKNPRAHSAKFRYAIKK